MSDDTKRKLVAGGKVVVGGARIVSGVATAFGMGIVGSFLRHHHMQRTATQVAKMSLEGGKKMLQSGLADLRS